MLAGRALDVDGGRTPADSLHDGDQPTPEARVVEGSLYRDPKLALHRLSARAEKVVWLCSALHSEREHTLEEIGRRAGLTWERIRQVKETAMAKLRQRCSAARLRAYAERTRARRRLLAVILL